MDGPRGSRRWFLAKVTVLTGLAGGLLLGAVRLFRAESTDEQIARISPPLRKVAIAVLPTEVPEEEARRAVGDFLEWLRLYREGVEMAQFAGYGLPKKTPPSPLGRYREQMRQLERDSARRYGRPLESLEPASVRALVAEALDEDRRSRGTARRPPSKTGLEEHVVRTFLSFYFRSDDGVNRCYRAVINPGRCQGWGTDDRPAPLPS